MCGSLIEFMKQGHHPYVEDPDGRQYYLHYDDVTDDIMVSGPGLQTAIGGAGVPVWLVEWFQEHLDGNDVDWVD